MKILHLYKNYLKKKKKYILNIFMRFQIMEIQIKKMKIKLILNDENLETNNKESLIKHIIDKKEKVINNEK